MRRRIFVLGSANMDLVFAVDRMPREGETLAGGDLALFPGGKGANQAVAAARLGGDVAMIGAVGTDAFGQALLQSMDGAGVDTGRIRMSARPTGCACIYVMPGGANSIVVSPGANADLDVETALARLEDLPRTIFSWRNWRHRLRRWRLRLRMRHGLARPLSSILRLRAFFRDR